MCTPNYKLITKTTWSSKYEDDFLRQVDIINQGNYVYGNDVLYSIFKKDIFPDPQKTPQSINKLASAIWLVGRAYAASPERRSNASASDDGLGDFFNSLAQKIVGSKEYNEFFHNVSSLRNKTYSYNQPDFKG